MTARWKRTDLGLWLLHAGAILAGVGIVGSAFAHAVLSSTDEQTVLTRLLVRFSPSLRTAILAGLAAAATGAAVCSTGSAGRLSRTSALLAAAGLGGSVAAVVYSGGYAPLVRLVADDAFARTALAANAAGWIFVLLHASGVAEALGQARIAHDARRAAVHVFAAGAWQMGVYELAARLREARAAKADLDGVGTTLVVAGAGLVALASIVTAWSLHLLVATREAIPRDDVVVLPPTPPPTPPAEPTPLLASTVTGPLDGYRHPPGSPDAAPLPQAPSA